MSRDLGPSRRDLHAIGIIITLGATAGAGIGAAIGAALGDLGAWMGMGIPVGVSAALAAGAVFSKPTRRESISEAASRWLSDDDDAAPTPLSRTQDRSQPAA
jgi:predicted MFS family arabinose efflux permease